MQISIDRTGFPFIGGGGLLVHLLPVTKVQFERFLAESPPHSPYGDTWYETVLQINPRVSYRHFTAENREGIFITGILPEEALGFARWLGEGFRLPSLHEWRMVYQALLQRDMVERKLLQQLLSACGEQARTILEKLVAHPTPAKARSGQIRWLDLALMHHGLVEWVKDNSKYIGLGSPRPQFYSNLWNPLVDEVAPLRPGERLAYFGFRLVRPVPR